MSTGLFKRCSLSVRKLPFLCHLSAFFLWIREVENRISSMDPVQCLAQNNKHVDKGNI